MTEHGRGAGAGSYGGRDGDKHASGREGSGEYDIGCRRRTVIRNCRGVGCCDVDAHVRVGVDLSIFVGQIKHILVQIANLCLISFDRELVDRVDGYIESFAHN